MVNAEVCSLRKKGRVPFVCHLRRMKTLITKRVPWGKNCKGRVEMKTSRGLTPQRSARKDNGQRKQDIGGTY